MSTDNFLAHIVATNPSTSSPKREHSLSEHLLETAKLAGSFVQNAGLDKWAHWAYIAGLAHDLGKYSPDFQKRLQGTLKKVVDHSTAGAKKVYELDKKLGKILAYVISGHHAGLPNGSTGSKSDQAALDYKLEKTVPTCLYPESLMLELQSKFPLSLNDLPFPSTRQDRGFATSVFIRFLYSCVTDADFLNTEEFFQPERTALRKGYPSLEELEQKLEHTIQSFFQKENESELSQKRCSVLRQCLNSAAKAPGIFSLTVPTGGGKTISSLAFALKHAIKNKMNRIIYVIPYTSIIEQNADVFRKCLGEDVVIEHHSNYDPKHSETEKKAEEADELDELRYFTATENWDAPLIVTTNVQFFESFFSCKSSRCRKLHNVMNSVVIFDEAQMLPQNMLLPCLAIIRELTNHYHTSAVICTATQPALSKKDDFPKGLDIQEIIQSPSELYQSLRRVEVKKIEGDGTNQELSDEKLVERILSHQQVLCVVNTRNHARCLFEMLGNIPSKYHLSGLMCPEHRSQTLKEIKITLEKGLPCCLISTQLIEAGVDIDFPVVYRAMAGIDSIAQTAGRCNREGKLRDIEGKPTKGQVFVFETDKMLSNMTMTSDQSRSVFRRYLDVLSLDAVQDFFQKLFWVQGENILDKKNILHTMNYDFTKWNFNFRKIAQDFQIIEDTLPESVIIPGWENEKRGAILCEELKSFQYTSPFPSWQLLRKLQRYTVNISTQDYQKLLSQKAISLYLGKYTILENRDIYDSNLGLCTSDPTYMKPDSLIV